jgi:hypothetical protein
MEHIIPNDPLVRAYSNGYILYDAHAKRWLPWFIHTYKDIIPNRAKK